MGIIETMKDKVSFDDVVSQPDAKLNFVINTGNKGYFTILRIDRETVPEGWYAYDVRHSATGNICAIEKFVAVNHAGTFLTKQEVKMNKLGYKALRGRRGYAFI